MPEIAEAATIGAQLSNVMTGATITKVDYTDKAKQKNMCDLVTPANIVWVGSYGKKVLMLTSNSQLIVTSLGMTGRWQWAPTKHSHLSIHFTTPDHHERVVYFDQSRPFGFVETIACGVNVVASVRKHYKLGLDPLRDPPTEVEWNSMLAGETVTRDGCNSGLGKKVGGWQISKALLDQSWICGIGNYLTSEILFDARVRPDRVVNTLTMDESSRLYSTMLKTVRQAYLHHGLTIENYWSPDGDRGSYPVKVYGRSEVEVDGVKYLVKKETFKCGRTSHWVPQLQV